MQTFSSVLNLSLKTIMNLNYENVQTESILLLIGTTIWGHCFYYYKYNLHPAK